MTWCRVALYWACFVALTAYYVAVEQRPASDAAAHVTRAPFLNMPETQIEMVELRREGQVVRCRRVDQRWRDRRATAAETAQRIEPDSEPARVLGDILQERSGGECVRAALAGNELDGRGSVPLVLQDQRDAVVQRETQAVVESGRVADR